ncbi:ATP-binding protein [Streptomyces pathocidini]|uniref:ATP-binding protein n=1 Tax=Streptomyces pathocidini TaxID=1650571 RepID=UPI0033E3D86E
MVQGGPGVAKGRASTVPVKRRLQVQHDSMLVSFVREDRRAGAPIPLADARRVEEMRRLAAARLRYCGLDDLVADVELVVSELVTNALEHGDGREVGFSFIYRDDTVHITVADGSTSRPCERKPDHDAESGRGLLLVSWVAAEHGGAWGVGEDGTSTWCTLKASSTADVE